MSVRCLHPLRPAPALALLLAAGLTVGLAACASDAPPPPPCAQAFLPGADSAVTRALRTLTDCPTGAVSTESQAILIALGDEPAGLRVLPAPCASPAATSAGAVAVEATPAAAARCPEAAAQLAEALAARPPPLRELAGPDVAPGAAEATAAPPPTLAARYIRHVLPALWLLLLLTGLWSLAARLPRARRAALLAPEALTLAAITLGGLALRLWLPPGGAGDIFNSLEEAYHGPDATPDFGLYGRGVDALLHLLAPLRRADDDLVCALSLAAGTLSLPAIAAFVRRLGYPPRVALTAALLLAVTPLHVRYSPTVNRYILLIFLVLLGFTLLLAWLEDRRPADLATATVALTLAPQCRPDAVFLPAAAIGLVLAWWLARRPDAPPLPRWPLALAAALHLGLVLWPTLTVLDTALNDPALSQSGLALGDRRPWSATHNAFLAAAYTPLAWPLACLAGLLRPPPGRLWLHLWLAATALVATVTVASTPIGDNLDTARYHLLAVTLLGILAAAATGWLPAPSTVRTRALAVACALALAATATGPLRHTTAPRTMDAEYAFLRAELPVLPEGCTVVRYDPQGVDLTLRVSAGLSISSGRRLVWVSGWPLPSDPACAVYYRSAGCDADVTEDADRRHRLCDGLMAQVGAPLAERDVLARSAEGFAFTRDPVRVGLYWLVRPGSTELATPR